MSKRKATEIDSCDNFKNKFKYYKSNKPKPSLTEVLSVDSDKASEIHTKNVTEDLRTQFLGLKPLSTWKMYGFQDHPGLVFIQNPFESIGQRYWIRRCLEEYPRKPNKMNIDIEMSVQDWWKECLRNDTVDVTLQKKMRWSTLGYHHDWDTKVYTEENKSVFPEELAELSDIVAEYLGYADFKAEAAIVNYYHMDSTLSAHTDHSEVNLDAPLLSFSFGQSAIFLIGGKEKCIQPSAVLINSGDIVIMSKEARLCYHAVPKILKAKQHTWNDCNKLLIKPTDINVHFKYVSDPDKLVSLLNKNVANEEWSDFSLYIEGSRINMNVRQVLNNNQLSL